MRAPQIIIIGILVLGFAVSVIEAGKPQGVYNPVIVFFDSLIFAAILTWGGFFKC